jgi:hypothetical protein
MVTRPFVVAIVLLGIGALLAGPVARWADFRQTKAALPLKASLSTLSAEALRPYKDLHREDFDPSIVEALGTDEYLSWHLEDTSVAPNDPLRYANLLVTYYSGGNALVPHTPDVCYLGSGYEPAQAHENTEISLPSLDSNAKTVPIRVCSFARTAVFNREITSVVYTFYCNGRFAATRTGVRLLTHDPRDTHAFFSKVEVSFPRATREQNINGAKKLFDRLLPVLTEDHWPDFEAAEGRSTTAARPTGPDHSHSSDTDG